MSRSMSPVLLITLTIVMFSFAVTLKNKEEFLEKQNEMLSDRICISIGLNMHRERLKGPLKGYLEYEWQTKYKYAIINN